MLTIGSSRTDASCAASHPELVSGTEGLFVTWAERCDGGPWRVELLRLQ